MIVRNGLGHYGRRTEVDSLSHVYPYSSLLEILIAHLSDCDLDKRLIDAAQTALQKPIDATISSAGLTIVGSATSKSARVWREPTLVLPSL